MSEKHSLKVCVVGLGSMGLGIAGSLLRAGFDVVGCDVTAQARAGFSGLGGRVEDTPEAASNSLPTGCGRRFTRIVSP